MILKVLIKDSWPTGHMSSMTISISVKGWIAHTIKTIWSTSTKLIVLNIEATNKNVM